MKNRNEKQFVLSILLVVVILGIGTTIALSTAISKPVVNSFQAADHETNIKEGNRRAEKNDTGKKYSG